nr:uncharacterized protein LOC112703822 isoform X2 [Arachis hypogaea]XP_025673990.1 uncharacterized protein LOC112773145 isoform X2 [Arachis hypogaea]
MEGAKRLQGNSLSLFSEGIGFVLLRWSALRDAVENQWGGPDSRLKADNLATDILSWFTQSREPLYIDDLEDKLYDGMISLNVVVEDGSTEEIVNDKDDDEDEEDDDVQSGQNGESSARQATSSNMDVDIPKSESNMSSCNMRIDDEPLKKDAGEAEDGWVVVSKKKNKVRKN